LPASASFKVSTLILLLPDTTPFASIPNTPLRIDALGVSLTLKDNPSIPVTSGCIFCAPKIDEIFLSKTSLSKPIAFVVKLIVTFD
jgi:hypothetical protein